MSDFTVLDGITVDDIPVKFNSEDILTDSFEVDPTLTVSGAAADAKVTGDEISSLKEDLINDTSALSRIIEITNFDGEIYKHTFASAGSNIARLKLIKGATYQAVNLSASTDGNRTITIGGRKEATDASTSFGTIYNATPVTFTPSDDFEYIAMYSAGTAVVSISLVSGIHADIDAVKKALDDREKVLTLKSLDYDIVEYAYIRAGVSTESTSVWFRHTSFIDISYLQKVVISAQANYGNDLYAFYDSSKNYISSVKANSATTLDQEIVTNFPANTKYIIVASGVKAVQPFVGAYLPIVNDELVEKTKGKTWAVIGDSLTDQGNTTSAKRYFEWLMESDCTIVNLGVSGSGYLRNNGETVNNFVAKADALVGDEGYDIISVFGGVNDSGYVTAENIGELGDTTTDTYYGAIYTVFNTLQAKFPTAFIFAITPTVADYRHGANNTIDQLSDAIKDVCRWLKIPVADVNATCPLKPWLAANQEKYYADGLHPNASGHKLIANSIRSVFEYMDA